VGRRSGQVARRLPGKQIIFTDNISILVIMSQKHSIVSSKTFFFPAQDVLKIFVSLTKSLHSFSVFPALKLGKKEKASLL
jgi:hypothetical protein